MDPISTVKRLAKTNKKEVRRQYLRARCHKSFYFFVQEFWSTIIAEEPVWNWHIGELCNELQEIGEWVARREKKAFDYYIFNVPPGSSKSTIISEMYPIWCWTIDATQRFICASYASTPAEDIADKSYQIFMSDKFKWLFPELREFNTGAKSHFKNGKRGERYTTSTGSAITGIHAHQLIIDDPMSPQIASSPTERPRANKWVSETLGSRKVNAEVTITIVVMQRLHELDTTGYLLKKAEQGLKIKHISIPAEINDNIRPIPERLSKHYIDGLFDPKRRSRESLQQTKIELGSYGYAGQILQKPAPAEGGILKKAWFGSISRPLVMPGVTMHFQLDTAFTENTKNDPTAIIAYYVEHNQVYITKVISVYKEFPELLKWLLEFVRDHGYSSKSKIHVEPKASGLSLVQTIKKTTMLNIITSTAPKEDKRARVEECSPKVEACRVILHAGGWNESFTDQCASFPNAEHDDEVDCLTAIIKRELPDRQVQRQKPLTSFLK